MLPEIDYSKDPQNVSPHCYDIFGDEGMMCDPGDDNYDSGNAAMTLLVQQLGTRYILEQLGYEKRVIE